MTYYVLIRHNAARRNTTAWLMLGLISLVTHKFGVGVIAILTDITVGFAVAHIGQAAILLLVLLRLSALCSTRQALV